MKRAEPIQCDYCDRPASRVITRGLKANRRFACPRRRRGTSATMRLSPIEPMCDRHFDIGIADLEKLVRAGFRAAKLAREHVAT